MKLNLEDNKQERLMLKEKFEEIFNKHNWVEAMTDQEYIQEYSAQYQIFLEAYYLFKPVS